MMTIAVVRLSTLACIAGMVVLTGIGSAQPVRVPGTGIAPRPVLDVHGAPTPLSPELSRDGSRMLLVDFRDPDTPNAWRVVDTRTGALLAAGTTTAPFGFEPNVVLSPDGRRVSYMVAGDVAPELRVRDLTTGVEQPRLSSLPLTSVQDIADDGTLLARGTRLVDSFPPVLVDAAGAVHSFPNPCPAVPGAATDAPNVPARFSGDGTHIAYTRFWSAPPLGNRPPLAFGFDVIVANRDGSNARCVTRGPDGVLQHLTPFFVDLDGATIAVNGYIEGTRSSGPHLIDTASGRFRRLSHGQEFTRLLGMSEDARRVLVQAPSLASSSGEWGLFVFDPVTGVLEVLSDQALQPGRRVVSAAISGDGHTVVFATDAIGPGGVSQGTDFRYFVAALDADADGLHDAWERTYGLDISDDADAALDADGDRLTNAQEFAAGSHPGAAPVRYFAEGAAGMFFDTSLALFNPTANAVTANLRFLGPDGVRSALPITVPAGMPTYVDTYHFGVPASEFSTVVESAVPLVVERRMAWPGPTYGSHSGTGVDAPATTWHFAEGATIAGFQTFFLLQNPNEASTTVTMRYLLADETTQERQHVVPPGSRRTVWANQEGGPMTAAEFGTTIASDLPIVTERAMYRDAPGEALSAGSVASGIAQPATSWFFAEGATGAFFDTYLLLANPGDVTATVDVEFLRAHDPADVSTALPIARRYVVAPRSRQTIWIRQEDPALADTQVGVRLASTIPIVAERTMWWPGPTAATWRENHAEVGATTSGPRWAVGDMQADGFEGGWDTFLLVATTQQSQATVRVAVSCSDGVSATRDLPLSVNRTTLWMRHEFPQIVGRRCAATIESLPTRVTSSPSVPLMRTPIVVEKAMYFGADFRAGSATLATRLPDP